MDAILLTKRESVYEVAIRQHQMDGTGLAPLVVFMATLSESDLLSLTEAEILQGFDAWLNHTWVVPVIGVPS